MGGRGLSVVLANLLPLLRESVEWFEGVVGEQTMLEVRSSKLETRLSSSDNPVEVEEDIVALIPREVRVFHAFEKECGLEAETLSKFRERFQFS